MQLQFHKKAAKFISKLPPQEKQRIKQGINKLINSPENCDIKPLQGYNNIYRLRIGQYRVIYTGDGFVLSILNIGNRGDIYKK